MRTSHLQIATVFMALVASCQWVAAQVVVKEKAAEPTPVRVEEGKVGLTPENTAIQFVGLHMGDEPNPRVGHFTKFKGALAIDQETALPTAADVEIVAASLTTPIAKLNDHLKSPDFFSVREFPKITFKSTRFEATDAAAGKFKVTGDLTIRDTRKSISFPADIKVSRDGALLTSKFKVKRSDFGMTFAPDRVVDEVTLTVAVGKPTPTVEVQ